MIENKFYAEKRKEYLNGNISHDEYYCWLGNFIGVTEADVPFSKEQLEKSKDIHFNDLSLKIWDSKHSLLYILAKNKSLLTWSYADTVCVLKSLARKVCGKPSL